jgi:hypothetical protein
MKPKPFSALNHLTVPCAIRVTLPSLACGTTHFAHPQLPLRLHSTGEPVYVERNPVTIADDGILLDYEELQLQPRRT